MRIIRIITSMGPSGTEPNYDFIMNSSKSSKKSLLPNGSMKQRIITVGAVTALLIVVAMIASNLLSAAANKGSSQLIDLAAYQTALKTIIAVGADKSRDATLKNNATTAKYTLESDYQQLTKIIKSRGIKIPKDFATRYNTTTLTTQLDEADKANRFDEEFTEVYKDKLTNYKTKLSETYYAIGDTDKTVILNLNSNVKVLLGEQSSTSNQ